MEICMVYPPHLRPLFVGSRYVSRGSIAPNILIPNNHIPAPKPMFTKSYTLTPYFSRFFDKLWVT